MAWKTNLKHRFIIGLVLGLLAAAGITAETPDTGKPIENLQFQSADIRSVLTFLADYGGVNVVIAPGVEGTVTIKLRDVQWRQAMDIIGRTYNLAVVDEDGGYIRILDTKAHREELTEQEKHRVEQRKLVDLETKIVRISNSVSGDIITAVKSLLTERGKVDADSRSNSIIIQEVPANMPRLLEYIAELDKPPYQIKISAQLLEIYTDDFSELGFDWNVIGKTQYDHHSVTQQADVNASDVSKPAATYQVTVAGQGYDITAFVDAIVSNGKGKIIARPEITTIDNHEAKIQMGAKVPVKQFDESGNVVIQFEEVGTILTVIPHITAENQILMYLKPERSTYEFDPNGIIINTSNAETHVIVANGQTAVIGGLTTEDEIESEHGVPILKDIPILGMFFKYKTKETKSRDLVIFVTPTIVDNELAMGGG